MHIPKETKLFNKLHLLSIKLLALGFTHIIHPLPELEVVICYVPLRHIDMTMLTLVDCQLSQHVFSFPV